MRPDLVLESHGENDQRHWVAKDPVTLRYYRLREEEFRLLGWLDGFVTLDELRQRFEAAFAPLQLSLAQLQQFLYRLHELGLVVADSPGQGEMLLRRDRESRWRAWWGTVANPLAVRLPGLRAEPLIDWLYLQVRWMFAPGWLAVCLAVVFSAVLLVASQLGSFRERLPDFQEFFHPRAAVGFAVVLAIVKVLHELGHALVCRHFGATCHEIGLMLLVGTPSLYCDVTDAWRLRSRGQRIAVAAAGMGVELVLAAIATWLWWFSEPGLPHTFCLRVMFLGSVSTLLFNANPLLKCDGYYILSDWLDVPNLGQESQMLWRRRLAEWLLGAKRVDDPTLSPRLPPVLLIYGAAATAYRCLMMIGVLWFVFAVLEPHGLGVLAVLLAAVVIGGWLAAPIGRGMRIALRPQSRRHWRHGRVRLTALVFVGLLAAVIWFPLPHRLPAVAWLEPQSAVAVYATVPGHLEEAVPPGTTVAHGDRLVRLTNADIDLLVADLELQLTRQERRLQAYRLLQSDDPSIGPLLPAAEKSLEDLQQQLAQRRHEQEQLAIVSPTEGVVLPPSPIPSPSPDVKRLVAWHGSPLEPRNRGCFVETGTLLCHVGDPRKLVAMLIIDQTEVPFARVGQRVRVRIESPICDLEGTIEELAKADAKDLPPELVRGLELSVRSARAGAESYYQARVKLRPTTEPLLPGMRGTARITAEWEPAGARAWRYLQRTFGG